MRLCEGKGGKGSDCVIDLYRALFRFYVFVCLFVFDEWGWWFVLLYVLTYQLNE